MYTATKQLLSYLGYVLLLLRPLFLLVIHPYSQIGVSSKVYNYGKFDVVYLDPYRGSLPYHSWWSGWRQFSTVVLCSTPRSITTEHDEPWCTAVIAPDRSNYGTTIQVWCTATTSQLTLKIFTRDHIYTSCELKHAHKHSHLAEVVQCMYTYTTQGATHQTQVNVAHCACIYVIVTEKPTTWLQCNLYSTSLKRGKGHEAGTSQ